MALSRELNTLYSSPQVQESARSVIDLLKAGGGGVTSQIQGIFASAHIACLCTLDLADARRMVPDRHPLPPPLSA